MFKVNLSDFVGYTEILEHHSLKELYKTVVSTAKGAGQNLTGLHAAFIYQDDRLICCVSNYKGYVTVTRPDLYYCVLAKGDVA